MGLYWTGRPFDISAALPLWPRSFNSVAPLLIAHGGSSCVLPQILLPYPPCTPFTEPVPSVAPVRWGPPPLFVSCMPHPNDFLPPGRGGRPCRMSYQRLSAGPPYQTGQPGYQIHPGYIRVPTMQPCHRLHRRRQPSAYPPVHDRLTPLIPLPSPPPSVPPPHPPHYI